MRNHMSVKFVALSTTQFYEAYDHESALLESLSIYCS